MPTLLIPSVSKCDHVCESRPLVTIMPTHAGVPTCTSTGWAVSRRNSRATMYVAAFYGAGKAGLGRHAYQKFRADMNVLDMQGWTVDNVVRLVSRHRVSLSSTLS